MSFDKLHSLCQAVKQRVCQRLNSCGKNAVFSKPQKPPAAYPRACEENPYVCPQTLNEH